MLTANHAVTVHAPRDAVWSVVSRPLRAPEWVQGVRRVEFVTDAKAGVGAGWRETVVLGPLALVRMMEITREDAPRELVVESVTRPRFEARYALDEESAETTRVRIELEYELPLGAVGRFAEPTLGASFGTLLARRSGERLKRVAERSTSATLKSTERDSRA